MERDETVRRLVLDAICDDYENVDQVILSHVADWATKLGWTIEREEVVNALAWLVENGMAKAYDLSASTTKLSRMPPLNVIEEDFRTYFRITEKGMKLHLEPCFLDNYVEPSD